MKSGRLRLLVLFAGTVYIQSASALCLDDRHPGVRQELATSHAVVLGRVLAQRNVAAPDDPGGIDHTIYDVQVLRRFKGPAQRMLQVTSENTSSRFPMTVGTEYLLLLAKDGSGYFVDACGNSGESRRRQAQIASIAASVRRK